MTECPAQRLALDRVLPEGTGRWPPLFLCKLFLAPAAKQLMSQASCGGRRVRGVTELHAAGQPSASPGTPPVPPPSSCAAVRPGFVP